MKGSILTIKNAAIRRPRGSSNKAVNPGMMVCVVEDGRMEARHKLSKRVHGIVGNIVSPSSPDDEMIRIRLI